MQCHKTEVLPPGEFRRLFFIRAFLPALVLALVASAPVRAKAQSAAFAGNAQHTALYSTPAQALNTIRWSTSIDLNNTATSTHYGAPLITPANTVVVPVKLTNGFQVSAFDGATGRLKYTLASDYLFPSLTNIWIPTYQPVLASAPSGLRLYYPGPGGTVYYIDNPDSDTPSAPVQQCFYTDLASYQANATGSNGFNSTVFLNTPIIAATNGTIFFGFRVQQTAPAPLNTTNSGFARIDSAGSASYVLVGPAANDTLIGRDSHNCAPALSNDGATLYVAVKHYASAAYNYLLGLDSVTLATKYKTLLRDPVSGNYVSVSDSATASPTVGPDDDVYFGVLSGVSGNNSRGFLLHFSADLQTKKIPSAFGWDYTPAIVPTNMVPYYTGTSSYLLFSKYNNYAGGDGNGINRIALLDPNATQTDPHPGANSLSEMREVMTVLGPTPDVENMSTTYPLAVREWCINTGAINPATFSVFAPSEDGHIYRWNLATNALTEVLTLGSGLGEPYVPTTIGPDGTVYTLNGGTLFALGGYTNLSLAVYSSAPDLRSTVTGEPITFTAVLKNLDPLGPVPTGTITFEDRSYNRLVPFTNILAADVPLNAGIAAVTNSSLAASSNYLGNHFITARYSGDANFQPGQATLVQKVHATPTTTTLTNSTPGSGPTNALTLTATVSSAPPTNGTPTGFATFWDHTTVLAQIPFNTNGVASFTVTNVDTTTHVFSVTYNSDTLFAVSTASLAGAPPYISMANLLSDGSFQLGFSNVTGAAFSVLGTTDPLLSLSNWPVLGPATEVAPGQFQFTDPQATSNAQRFYRVRSP